MQSDPSREPPPVKARVAPPGQPEPQPPTGALESRAEEGVPVDLKPTRRGRKLGRREALQMAALSALALGLVALAAWWALTRSLAQPPAMSEVPPDAITLIHSSTPIALQSQPRGGVSTDQLSYAPPSASADWTDGLTEAYRARQKGHYGEAVAQFSALVGGGRPTEARHALWGLAETYETSGRLDLAMRAYSLFTHLDDPRAELALGRVGHLYERMGRTSQAAEVYVDFEKLAGPARHAIMLMRARLLGDSPQAEKLYMSVLDDKPLDVDLRQALAGLAALKARQGQHAQAAQLYDQLASVRRANPRPALDNQGMPAEVLAAQELRAAGDVAGARRRLVEYIQDACPDPRSCTPSYPSGAYWALDSLLKLDATIVVSGTISPLTAARIAYTAGYYGQAIGYMNNLRTTSPTSPSLPTAALLTGRAFEVLGDPISAYNWYTATVQTYPASSEAPEAARRAGDALVKQAAWDAALSVYQEVVHRYPDAGEQTALARIAGAVLAYRLDRRDAALDLISPLLAGPVISPTIMAQAAFWHGKLLKGLGDAGWRQSMQKVSRLAPGSYYDFRAQALLAGEPDGGPLVPGFPVDTLPISDPQTLYTAEAAEREVLLEWAINLTATHKTAIPTIAADTALTPASAPVAGTRTPTTPTTPGIGEQGIALPDPELIRAITLLDLGYADEAYRSLLAVGQRMATQGNVYGLAQLVTYARYHADTHTAMSLADVLASIGEQVEAGDPRRLPTLLLKTMYPTPYAQLVLEEARTRDVDPLLIYALIRQESQFVPDARSHADARGLTQVIPSTGEGIAAQLDDGDFSVQDLYLPYVSVRYGVYYLMNNAPTFDRRLLPTLAAYNGGPGNAARWLAGSALIDPDLYVERIDLPETQDYLIRVYQNYGFYRYVYTRER